MEQTTHSSINGISDKSIGPREDLHSNGKPSDIDWESLIYDMDLLSARVLQCFYLPHSQALTLRELTPLLNKFKVGRETLRKRIVELNDIGLLEVIPATKPLCVHTYTHIENNVKKLITLVYARHGMKALK